jgi:hypothetical protein
VCALYDQTKAHKSGSTVPIRLRLCNDSGTNVSSPGLDIVATGVVLIATKAPGVLDDAGNANRGNQFRFTADEGGAYIFNLKTTGLVPGTYGLTFVVSGDPTVHMVQFQVR